MKTSSFVRAASLLSSLFAPLALAQETFTHEGTGIEFWRQTVSDAQTAGGFEWGWVLPGEPTGANDEYIGYIVSYSKSVWMLQPLMFPRKVRSKQTGRRPHWTASSSVRLKAIAFPCAPVSTSFVAEVLNRRASC